MGWLKNAIEDAMSEYVEENGEIIPLKSARMLTGKALKSYHDKLVGALGNVPAIDALYDSVLAESAEKYEKIEMYAKRKRGVL